MNKATITLLLAVTLWIVSTDSTAVSAQTIPTLTHGVASGDVTSSSAVIWARSDREGILYVRYRPSSPEQTYRYQSRRNGVDTDFAAQVTLTGLKSYTEYEYEAWFESLNGVRSSEAQNGSFRTAPDSDESAPLSFIWAGDLGGQQYCRRVDTGYGIFNYMNAFNPDFFIANGDMIYADGDCPVEGPDPGWINVPGDFRAVNDTSVDWLDRAEIQEIYRAHWRYNRADSAFQSFLAETPMYVQWDDHEVINDFGAPWSNDIKNPNREGFPNIVDVGRKAFFDYHPISRNLDEPDRIYRSFRWGNDVELFILDARSYRSENELLDTPENAKTLLGREQLDWITESLINSSATWKIISNDVPLSIATGSSGANKRDAFANGSAAAPESGTGFESELLQLLAALDAANVINVVFVATDVHFAAQIRYDTDIDGDGDTLLFHELISGPLNAIRTASPTALDPTLHPVVLYAEGDIFNFGTVRIESDGSDEPRLSTDIRDQNGRIRVGSELVLSPE